MGRIGVKTKGQASPDFAMSAMIFSLAALFVFFHLARTYYTRVWEVERVEATASAQNLALFLASEKGKWSDNPFLSDSIGLGSTTLNKTRVDYFFGMPTQTVQSMLAMSQDFRIEVWKLPRIGITSDTSDIYINSSVDVVFETTVNSTLNIVLVGTQGSKGYAYWNTSQGKYHNFDLDLPSGIYSIKALATSGDDYGAYESAFRVIG
ncbi:MAG: hypothetical protein GOU98_03475 [Candidatus Altiarchaeota archaeon]|nr:hypothetical protein [Candidatus Altiarchaeota archaeon]